EPTLGLRLRGHYAVVRERIGAACLGGRVCAAATSAASAGEASASTAGRGLTGVSRDRGGRLLSRRPSWRWPWRRTGGRRRRLGGAADRDDSRGGGPQDEK